MLSYEEVEQIFKQYRLKIDSETGEKTLIDRNNPDALISKEDELKYRAAIYLSNAVNDMTTKFKGLVYEGTEPWHNEEEKREWKKEKVSEIQNFVSSIANKGYYSIRFAFLHQPGECDKQFFCDLQQQDDKFSSYAAGAKSLLEYTLAQKGKVLNEFRFVHKDLVNHYSWTTKSLQKAPISPEGQAKRKKYAEDLIKAYLRAESNDMYNTRVKTEEKNMHFVATTVNESKTIPDYMASPINANTPLDGSSIIPEAKGIVPKIMRLLIAAQDISLDGENDYLEEIISQPAISRTLIAMRNAKLLDKLNAIGDKKEQQGKVSNGRTHKETNGDYQRRIANEAINQDSTMFLIARYYLQNNSAITATTETKAALLCLAARTQGIIPRLITDSASGGYIIIADSELSAR